MSKADLPPLEKLDPTEAWAPWKPDAKDPFNAKWAAHLYRRAGYGPTLVELKEAVSAGLDSTFEKMLAPAKSPPKTLPPVNNPNLPGATIELRARWLQRMLSGAEPIRDKLTLFWHNHFATSIVKIQDAKLMQRQNELIRKHALGKFGPFLKEMSRDAAMLIWLDSNENVKAHPNENYAREVMELFSLGVGNYTEKDVQEAARAFTGWHVSGAEAGDRSYVFRANEHDDGKKTILRQMGDWNGDDVIRILLEQPACSRFIVRKLYSFYVSENVKPPDSFIQPLADELKKADYDISVTVKTILRSRHFFSAHAYRQKVKGPIDYIVGLGRMFGINPFGGIVVSPYCLIGSLELQGQQLYAPPNVKGWEGGKAWLNTATVLARHNFAYEMCNGMGQLTRETTKITGIGFAVTSDALPFVWRLLGEKYKIDLDNKVYPNPDIFVRFMGSMLLPDDLKPEIEDRLSKHLAKGVAEKLSDELVKGNDRTDYYEQYARDVMTAIVALPEYQLC
jgi:uncharacterized protein (DUF1800 family)